MAKPTLRFPQFNEEWVEQEFSTFCSTVDERTSDTTQYPLYSLTIEEGVVEKTDRYKRDFLITKEGDSYKIVPPNAFVFNPMNLRFGALKVNHSGKSVAVSGYYDIFSMGSEKSLAFWENYLVSPKMLGYYDSISTGSLVEKKRVHYSQFLKIVKPVPSKEEQEKIAEFLTAIDSRIEHQSKLVKSLELQKRELMNKIFNHEYSFKKEDGTEYPDWSVKTIAECCDCLDSMRKPITKSNRVSGEYPYYGATCIQDYVADYIFDEPLVLLAEDGGPFGDFREKEIAQYITGKTWVNNHAHVLRPHENVKYIYYNLVHRDIRMYINNPGRGKLNQADMCKIEIPIPSKEEQEKIVAFIDLLSQKNQKEVEILNDLLELKKGLLQKMFVI